MVIQNQGVSSANLYTHAPLNRLRRLYLYIYTYMLYIYIYIYSYVYSNQIEARNLRRREHGRRWRAERDEGTGLNMVPLYIHIYEIHIYI